MSEQAESADGSEVAEPVIWHDAENGAYAADLRLWERLAREHPGGVVDLGAGTGRVSLHLAASGHRVTAVDNDPALLAALAERAAGRGLEVETVVCDVRELDLRRPLPADHRPDAAAAHRRRDRRAAEPCSAGSPPTCSPAGASARPCSTTTTRSAAAAPIRSPTSARSTSGSTRACRPTSGSARRAIEMRRLRQRVAPDGSLDEEPFSISLDRFSMAEFDRDAAASGLRVVDAEMIPSSQRVRGFDRDVDRSWRAADV